MTQIEIIRKWELLKSGCLQLGFVVNATYVNQTIQIKVENKTYEYENIDCAIAFIDGYLARKG